jgi:hypothetical protein
MKYMTLYFSSPYFSFPLEGKSREAGKGVRGRAPIRCSIAILTANRRPVSFLLLTLGHTFGVRIHRVQKVQRVVVAPCGRIYYTWRRRRQTLPADSGQLPLASCEIVKKYIGYFFFPFSPGGKKAFHSYIDFLLSIGHGQEEGLDFLWYSPFYSFFLRNSSALTFS